MYYNGLGQGDASKTEQKAAADVAGPAGFSPAVITSIGDQIKQAIQSYGTTQATIRLAKSGLNPTMMSPNLAVGQGMARTSPGGGSSINWTPILIGGAVIVGGLLLVKALRR